MTSADMASVQNISIVKGAQRRIRLPLFSPERCFHFSQRGGARSTGAGAAPVLEHLAGSVQESKWHLIVWSQGLGRARARLGVPH